MLFRHSFALALLLITSFIISPALAQEKSSQPVKKNNFKTKDYDPWADIEDEEKDTTVPRIEFGLNFGAYFPNKFSANYYNGSPGNENNVNYVLSNYYWYQDIKRALVASDTVMVYSDAVGGTGYPYDMHYNVAFSGGVFLRLNIDRKSGFILQANYARLTADDFLVFEVDPVQYVSQLPDLRNIPVVGKEGRVLIDLAYQRSFPMKSKIFLFFQVGGTMCYTQMIRSYFNVEGTDYNMVNVYGSLGYIPGVSSQTYTVYQNAYGFGGYIGLGAGIPLTDNFSLEPNFFTQVYPSNLKGYTAYKPNFGVMLRIMMRFTKPEE